MLSEDYSDNHGRKVLLALLSCHWSVLVFIGCGFTSKKSASWSHYWSSCVVSEMFSVCSLGKLFRLLVVGYFVVEVKFCVSIKQFYSVLFYKYVDNYRTLLKVCQLPVRILQPDPMFVVDCEITIGHHVSAANIFFIGGTISLVEVSSCHALVSAFSLGRSSIAERTLQVIPI